jgi:hypothetical protein
MVFAIHPAPNSGGEEALGVYDDSTQEWFRVQNEAGKVTHLVGYEKAKPPRPQDLLRADAVSGYPVELQGGTFVVPILHVSLPMQYTLVARTLELAVDPRYQEITEEASRILLSLAMEREDPRREVISRERYYKLAVAALGINYRIGIPEAVILKLLDTHKAQNVAAVALGIAALEAHNDDQKKTE